MTFLSWLLIPITATASLNPVPTSTPKVPLLGEESSYVIDYPIDHENALKPIIEPSSTTTDEITTLIQQYFPENSETMYQVGLHESTLDPKAFNPELHKLADGSYCKGSYGVMQVGCNNYSGDPKDLFDPETNMKAARKVYDTQGYGAWGVCLKKIVDCDTITRS
jgi:hypothetical protein